MVILLESLDKRRESLQPISGSESESESADWSDEVSYQ